MLILYAVYQNPSKSLLDVLFQLDVFFCLFMYSSWIQQMALHVGYMPQMNL